MFVCVCKGLDEAALRAAIAAGASTPESLCARTGATTVCGCCAVDVQALFQPAACAAAGAAASAPTSTAATVPGVTPGQ